MVESENGGESRGCCSCVSTMRAKLATPWLVFRAFIGVYGVYQVSRQFTLSRLLVELTPTLPTDRCVPWFQVAANEFQKNNSLLYYSQNGISTLRLCTDLEATAVDRVLGAENRYDVLSVASKGRCSLPNISTSRYYECSGNDAACLAAINTEPKPYGISWAYAISGEGQDPFAFTLKLYDSQDDPDPCTMTLRKMQAVVAPCNKRYVWAYERHNAIILLVSLSAFSLTCVFFLFEIIGVAMACDMRRKGRKYMKPVWMISDDGSLGAFYLLYVVAYKKGQAPKIVPTTRRVHCMLWGILLSRPVVCQIMMPAIAIVGCSFDGNLQLMLLLIFGLVKTSFMILTTMYKCVCRAPNSEAAKVASAGNDAQMVSNPLRTGV